MESPLLRQWFAAGGAAVRYETIQLTHPSFQRSYYLINSTESITAALETGESIVWEPIAMQLKLPEKGVQGRESLQISIDGVSRDILQELEAQANGGRAPIELVYREYLDSDLSGPQDIRRLTLRNPRCNTTRITAEANFLDAVNAPFPRINYTSISHPWLL